MGLFDALKSVLGTRAESDATRAADPEDLFGMSTAHLTMEADLGFQPAGEAALCFSSVDSTDFADALDEVRAILAAGEDETGTAFRRHTDDHGYRWVVFADPDPEDLVTSVHFAADTFVERGYGSRLLAAVFAFERRDASDARASGGEGEARGARAPREGERRRREPATREDADVGARAYWVYSFRRGTYYPFAPRSGRERDQRLEFKLESVLDGELDVEGDEAYWYPLWPDRDGGHPWE